jgi:transcriptional regulator with XRE-family HTH domain
VSFIVETGEILKALRVLAKLKHDELAKKTKISRSWVYKLEEVEGPSPTIDIVRKWVKACKPKGAMDDWLSLSSQLLFDDNVVAVIENKEVEEKKAKLVPKWVVDMVPNRFLRSIK